MSGNLGSAWKGAIFDLDGTLVDTPQPIATIIGKLLVERGLSMDEDLVRATVGKPVGPSFAEFLGLPVDHPDVVSAIAAYRERFSAYASETGPGMLYEGVAAGLRSLRFAGWSLGLATSKIRAAAARMVNLTETAELFDALAGDDSVPRGKPHPDMALFVAAELGIEPGDCVVVGDGVGDIVMGRAAGMTTVGVTYGVATAGDLMAVGADLVVDSFSDLVGVLQAGRHRAQTLNS